MRRPLILLPALLVVALLTMGASGDCTNETDQYREAVRTRETTLERAEAAAPVPINVNFPARRALVEFTRRQDLLNHPWYVYILGDNGNVIGYYVAQTRPVNSCTFLSSTEKIADEGYEGSLVLTAPSLDGIFYGGAGASAGCDAWFFFDAATDAMIEIRGVKFFTADQPLRLEAEPISVKTDP